jgi:hypothetical protein
MIESSNPFFYLAVISFGQESVQTMIYRKKEKNDELKLYVSLSADENGSFVCAQDDKEKRILRRTKAPCQFEQRRKLINKPSPALRVTRGEGKA